MRVGKSCLMLSAVLGLILISTAITRVLAAQVQLAWDDPHNDPADVGGYILYYWQPQWEIPASVDVGNQTAYTLTGLEAGQPYAFAITAYDLHRERESSFSNVLTQTLPSDDAPVLKIGEVRVDHNWTQVTFRNFFVDPIVVAKPLSRNGIHPAVIRIENVKSSGFSIRVQEWGYLDGWHTLETVSYLVIERGSYTLPDGTRIEADYIVTDRTEGFEAVSFNQTFQTVPVIITAISSFNGTDAVTGRIRNINREGFEFRMQEQENNLKTHVTETIDYVAWESSSGTLDGLTFEVNTTPNIVTDRSYTISYNEPFADLPAFLADIQTGNGMDTAALRWTQKNISSIDIHIEEERSYDEEIKHTREIVGYMLFGRAGLD